MIQVKNALQLAAMRDAGRITGEALLAARDYLREGITTYELARVIHNSIVKAGAKPSPKGDRHSTPKTFPKGGKGRR